MGQRFEQNRTKVTENRNENERIRGEQTTLTNEYSPLQEINSFLDSLDDEIIGSVESVQVVGASEQSRLEEEKEQVSSEADTIASQLDDEIGKLDAGMKKLDQLEAFGFGQQSLDKGKSDYQKQIEQYKLLKEELLAATESGDVEAVNHLVAENSSMVESLSEVNSEDPTGRMSYEKTAQASQPTQREHKPFVSSREEAINAVINDVMQGSGRTISAKQAENYYESIQYFSGQDMTGENNDYRRIREAYNNPNAAAEDVQRMNYLDEYIKSAPKWEGEVYRGINIDESTANDILSRETVDMLGPASWSSEFDTAERFSRGSKPVRMVFILPENRSGASITHIASFDGAESEITAPSGIEYRIDRYERVNKDGREFIHVYLHE